MPDTTDTLLAKANSVRPRRYERIVLRTVVSGTFGLICFLLLILWVRSYTWRDRLVVPLTDTRFCRLNSDQGTFRLETYGPNMGEISFSVTALSHREISRAWKRYTNAPQPGPGKQWRLERTATGRFFIHVPHWFVAGLTLVFASLPWFRWLPKRACSLHASLR